LNDGINPLSDAESQGQGMGMGGTPLEDASNGIHTGYLYDMKNIDEVKGAVKTQLEYFFRWGVSVQNFIEYQAMWYAPQAALSISIEGCVEKGKDVVCGGAKYNSFGHSATGLATIADSITAIKYMCFDKKLCTTREMYDAIMANWVGYEHLRQIIINEVPHFGNDDPYVDDIAKEFVALSCAYCGSHTSIFGSGYINGLVPVISNIPHGEVIAALPSGRKSGTPLADGISPFPGFDKKGPSAVLKSVCRVDHTLNGCGTLLNMKLAPSLIASKEDKQKLIALLRAEGRLGGYHVQFNVVKRETLLRALETPQEYQDLLVRVAGYSAYFVELRKEAQNMIIDRTENAAW
jgi:formate C-acetyltransferase